MADEIELKLALPEGARRAFLRHPLLSQAEKLGACKLTNVYFDTPELALRRQRMALRTRKQGRAWLQTVKGAGNTSGGLAVRPEWEQPYDGQFDFSAVTDPKTRSLLERDKVRSRLAPVFETVFARRTWRLVNGAGSMLVALDRGWIGAGAAREEICEIELELERGEPAALFDAALALAQALPLRPEILSKAERGFRLHGGEPPRPVRAGGSPLRAGQTPWQAFCAIAAACIAQLQWNELGATQDDPEFIHQMRVALRRLRSALRSFRPALPPPGAFDVAVAQIRTLARSLGAARDWDVLVQEIVRPVRAAFPGDARLDTLGAAVAAAREQARAAACSLLASREHGRFILGFSALLHRPAEPSGTMPLEVFAARRLGRLHKKAVALAEAARDLDPGRLHALRIGAKRLRYAIEFFAPLYRAKDTKRALEVLIALQDALGALNDLASAGEPLLRLAGEDQALREAVALIGGWHGPRYGALRAALPGRIEQLCALKRFWRPRNS